MASRINPVPLMALILCVILTLVFTILVILKSGEVRRMNEGDPEKANFKWIPKLQQEVKEKLNRIEVAKRGIALRKQELYRLDLEGNIKRLYYDDGVMYGGVATPGNDTTQIGDKTLKLKDSKWAMTAALMQMDVKYMDGLRAEYESPARQEFPSLSDAIRKRQDEIKAVLAHRADLEAAFKADQERLDTQMANLTKEQEDIEKKARDDRSRRLTQITKLEDHIRELLELDIHWMVDRDKEGKIIGKAGLDPDGTILQADGQNLKVIIDKGSRDRIFPGLLFEAFSYDRGAYREKGKIEVIEVQEGISTCRILGQIDAHRNPIAKGDYVGNPVWDSRKPKVFVVAGEFKHYNKEDLEGFIRRTGGVVWPSLAPGVDFLVAGERSEKEQADARQYQILAMREDDLLQYVQSTFLPKPDKTGAAAPPAAAPAPAAPAAPAADAK